MHYTCSWLFLLFLALVLASTVVFRHMLCPSVDARTRTKVFSQWQPQAYSEKSCTHMYAVRLDRYDLRRRVAEPREGFTLSNVTMTTVAPIPYDVLKEGIVT